MTTTTKHWMLLTALAAATLASTLHAQTSRTTTRTVTRTNGNATLVKVSQGGGEDPQAKDDLFAGTEVFEKNATDATEITMDPNSLGMVGSHYGSGARNMVLNVVRSYSYDKPGMYDMAAVDAFRKKLNTGDWFCTVHTRNLKTGESTDVCQKHRTDGMREEAIITVEPKELTFIHTIRKASTSDGGHSQLFEGPLPAGISGDAAFAIMDPENFIASKLAAAGVIVDQMRGIEDMKIDMVRALRDSQLASIRPFTMRQLDNLKLKIEMHPDVRLEPLAPLPPLPTMEPAVPAEPAPVPEPSPAPNASPSSPLQ